MKKLVSLLLVLCLSIGVVYAALADAMPAFTVQPVDSTTDKYGNLSLTFKERTLFPTKAAGTLSIRIPAANGPARSCAKK